MHALASHEQDAVAAATGDMAEPRGEVGLADADRPEDEDVVMRFEEAQAGELGEKLTIEADLGGVVPGLELERRVQTSPLRAQARREQIATLALLGEDQLEEVLVRHRALPRQPQALGQRLRHRPELQPPQGRAQLQRDELTHGRLLEPAGTRSPGVGSAAAGGGPPAGPWRQRILLDRLLEHPRHPRHVDDVDLERTAARLLHGWRRVATHQAEQAIDVAHASPRLRTASRRSA